MQRLFSMFPAGAAGYGLLILRLCAAGMLMQTATLGGAVSYGSFQFIAATTVLLLLCLGLFTPVCCAASTVGQIAMRLQYPDRDLLQLSLSLSLTIALLLLGPGAFSLDSRLFGRRLIIRAR